MTNQQIIEDIAVNLYGFDAVCQMIEYEGEIPLHTALGWRARGPYRVKKGEKGIETRLWKKRRASGPGSDDQEGQKAEFYLSKAYLFGKEQVEIIKM